ncbi:class I SAM-dependent methyltransferase [Sphingomonas sp.]|jgi:SAM-dependent methyltransferase|uniref:class I SAM-dependent methyltransferase n=1 Tax=Sphingomonas sp. TaxID=28214 RepID=UPI002E1400E7|nr:class I SAM-dependent methyltransferase [Sphingomonas sp.]
MSETSALYADYDAWKGWGEPFRWNAEEGRYYAAELGRDPAGLDILEIGFGSGAFLGWARDKGARVMGAEITPASVAAAQTAQIPLVAPDFEAHGALAENSLDAVVAFDVFEHLDPATIPAKLAAIARALRPGGLLVLRYPNGQSPFGLDPLHADATHIVALSRAKIDQYAAGTGLRTIRYGATARVSSGSVARDAVRALRYILRGLHARFIRFVYATDVELAPVVTQVMVRQGEIEGNAR